MRSKIRFASVLATSQDALRFVPTESGGSPGRILADPDTIRAMHLQLP
jgi:hypothetical protein